LDVIEEFLRELLRRGAIVLGTRTIARQGKRYVIYVPQDQSTIAEALRGSKFLLVLIPLEG